MQTNILLSKLAEIGLPDNVISLISEKISSGENVTNQIQKNGLEQMLTSFGVDTASLANVDFSRFSIISEILGNDVDGDRKTGIDEVVDTFSTESKSTSILDSIKNFFK